MSAPVLVRAWRVQYADGQVRYKTTYRLDPVLGGSFTPEATVEPLPGVVYDELVIAPARYSAGDGHRGGAMSGLHGFTIGERVRYIGAGVVWVIYAPGIDPGTVFIRAGDAATVRQADAALLVRA